MKVVCIQENLAKGVSVVSRSIGKDLNLPVLANILIEAKGGVLKFSATNLEIGTVCSVRGKIEREGAVTVPAQLLVNYISSLPKSNVSLVVEYSSLKIECGSYSGEIKGIASSEFPLIPKINNEPFCRVASSKLKEALSKVAFAAARDETRPEISGVFLSVSGGKIRLAATDSYRLGEEVVEMSGDVGSDASMIIPVLTILEVIRVLDEGAGEVLMYLQENQIKFSFGDIAIVSRLVEGQYPDYLKIIPSEFTTNVELIKDELVSAIKTTSLFSKSDTSELRIVVKGGEKNINLSAESGQVGKNISKVSGVVSGKDVEIVFNSRYLLEGLSAMGGKKVKLKLLGSAGPGMLQDMERAGYLYIVMPIKK